jgi:hypothetical protein
MADLSQMTSSASELPAAHAPATAGGRAGWLEACPAQLRARPAGFCGATARSWRFCCSGS